MLLMCKGLFFFFICNHTTTMTTTATKYKKGKKKGKQKRKKNSADLQDLRYKISYTTYNTTENDLFTQHYVHKFSYNNIAYKSYIAVC